MVFYLAMAMLNLCRIALWPPTTGWSSFIPSRPAMHIINLLCQNTLFWNCEPILELTQARMRRGVRTTMRRGTRVKKPTHLFRSRGGRGLPQKGAHVVVSTMLAL